MNTTIEFAEMCMEQEERNECYDFVRYWAAYRDGALAQRTWDGSIPRSDWRMRGVSND